MDAVIHAQNGQEVSARRIAGFCSLFGLALFVAAWMNVLPIALLGRFMSEDGVLSSEKLIQFAAGQRWFGGGLFVAGALAWAYPLGPAILLRPIFMCRPLVFGSALFAAGIGIAAWSYWGLFDGIPHVTDAISHLFQAKILVSGHWYAELPPCPLAFFQHHVMMTTDGKWFTKYSPGHPLLLAAGLRMGDAAIFTIAAHAALLIATYGTARQFFDERVARVTALAMLFSPLSILLAGSLMSHTPFLAAFMLGGWAIASSMKSRPFVWATAAGLAFGWSFLIRPHEFLISAAAIACGALAARPAMIPAILRKSVPLALGLLPYLAIQAAWNHHLYGRAWALGYGFTGDASLFPMFQSTFGLHEGFGWAEALRLSIHRLVRFEQVLLGWPVSLPFLLFALWAARDPRVRFLVAACAMHAGVYFFYDYLGHEYEARYYFNLLPALFALMTFGIARWVGASLARLMAAVLLSAAGCIHAVAAYWPNALLPVYHGGYEQTTRCLHERALRELPEHSMVLIDSGTPENRFRYSAGFLFNDPALTGRVIYARAEHAEAVECLLQAFSKRAVFSYIAESNQWCEGRFDRLSLSSPGDSE